MRCAVRATTRRTVAQVVRGVLVLVGEDAPGCGKGSGLPGDTARGACVLPQEEMKEKSSGRTCRLKKKHYPLARFGRGARAGGPGQPVTLPHTHARTEPSMIPPAAARAWRAAHGYLDADGDEAPPWAGPHGLGGRTPSDGRAPWWKVTRQRGEPRRRRHRRRPAGSL